MITNQIATPIRMGIPKIVKIYTDSLMIVFLTERDTVQLTSFSFALVLANVVKPIGSTIGSSLVSTQWTIVNMTLYRHEKHKGATLSLELLFL